MIGLFPKVGFGMSLEETEEEKRNRIKVSFTGIRATEEDINYINTLDTLDRVQIAFNLKEPVRMKTDDWNGYFIVETISQGKLPISYFDASTIKSLHPKQKALLLLVAESTREEPLLLDGLPFPMIIEVMRGIEKKDSRVIPSFNLSELSMCQKMVLGHMWPSDFPKLRTLELPISYPELNHLAESGINDFSIYDTSGIPPNGIMSILKNNKGFIKGLHLDKLTPKQIMLLLLARPEFVYRLPVSRLTKKQLSKITEECPVLTIDILEECHRAASAASPIGVKRLI